MIERSHIFRTVVLAFIAVLRSAPSSVAGVVGKEQGVTPRKTPSIAAPTPIPLLQLLQFLNHTSRVFVIPQSHKLRVPQVVCTRPFEELDLRDDLGSYPHAFLHFLSAQRLAPSRFARFWEVDEGALRGN